MIGHFDHCFVEIEIDLLKLLKVFRHVCIPIVKILAIRVEYLLRR